MTTTGPKELATRLPLIDPDTAAGPVRDLLDGLASRRGQLGPMVRAMANSDALLRGYVDLSRAMKRSHLDRRVSERMSLAVQEWLDCGYCIAAHTEAARALGVSESEIELARQGTSSDPKLAAMVAFAQQVAAAPAEVSGEDLARLAEHGYGDEEIADAVGLVALNVLTGSFNLVAGIHPSTRPGSA
jgi:uncharacterized peroxidase-related enzyme